MTKSTNTTIKDVTAKDLRLVSEEFAALIVKVQLAMNGGASLAVMAFIGTGVADAYLPLAVYALGLFAFGAFLAAAVSGLSFFAARNYYEAKKHADDPIQERKDHDWAGRFYRLACFCAGLSSGAFALGAAIFCWSILTAASAGVP